MLTLDSSPNTDADKCFVKEKSVLKDCSLEAEGAVLVKVVNYVASAIDKLTPKFDD